MRTTVNGRFTGGGRSVEVSAPLMTLASGERIAYVSPPSKAVRGWLEEGTAFAFESEHPGDIVTPLLWGQAAPEWRVSGTYVDLYEVAVEN
ncbi:hypothetical protein [Pseudoroseicyclus tamaricis]|uniref:Uncharacterized protein n=1 Tax=Pseudoroseicyclus tamaricis TaxID=2705421 RepID=A0A6B2JSH3_9RHOB|nr:hypothetical protein [Pseudoroseicyclus tamaricis]NDV00965.1 hypothetical protein [Pseudoroseicyclus tamaricis]